VGRLKRRPYWRTILLGALALGVMVWSAVEKFGVPRADMVEFFVGSVLSLLLVVAAAAVTVLLWAGLRRLFRR